MDIEFQDVILFFTTSLTNLFFLPPAIITYKKCDYFQSSVLMMTFVTSTIYHLQESFLPDSFYVEQTEWHIIDNVFTLSTAINVIIYLMDNEHRDVDQQLQYFGLFLALFAQIKDPWNIKYTVFPIAIMSIICVMIIVKNQKVRRYNYDVLESGLVLLLSALLFFAFGLDDKFDSPYRFCHGCWHAFAGMALYYILQSKSRDPDFISIQSLLKRNKTDTSALLEKINSVRDSIKVSVLEP